MLELHMRDQLARARLALSNNPHARRERERRLAVKREVFTAYGGVRCSRCGGFEDDIDVLTIDHTDPIHEGRSRKLSGWRLYGNLRRAGFPPGYSVMCFNCNCGAKKGNVTPPQIQTRVAR